MGAAVYAVEWLNLHVVLTLIIQIPLGVLVYVCGSMLFKIESYTYVLNTAKNFLKRKKAKT